MTTVEELPEESIAILDSSVLFAMGGPSNEKYQAFERHVTRQNVTVSISDQVAEELGESPAAYTYQRDRRLRPRPDDHLEVRPALTGSDPENGVRMDAPVSPCGVPSRARPGHL